MSIKNYDNLFEYDSNVLPCSQNFRFVSYRINLHISYSLTKKENGKITHAGVGRGRVLSIDIFRLRRNAGGGEGWCWGCDFLNVAVDKV